MSRPKRDVPIPSYVRQEALAHRIAQGAAGTASPAAKAACPAVKLKLATTNPKPINKGLIGHPSPKLVVSNGLPDIDWS